MHQWIHALIDHGVVVVDVRVRCTRAILLPLYKLAIDGLVNIRNIFEVIHTVEPRIFELVVSRIGTCRIIHLLVLIRHNVFVRGDVFV